MKKGLDFLLQTRVVLGLGCGTTIFLNAIIYKLSLLQIFPVIIFGIASTHLVYTIPHMFFATSNSKNLHGRNVTNSFILLSVHLVAICLTLLFLTQIALVLAMALAIVCLLYFFGIQYQIFQIKSLRSIPFLKSIIIPLVWALTVSYLPMVQTSSKFTSFILMEIVRYFFFFLAIATIFDLLDRGFDVKSNLKSIPTYLGIKISRYISIVSTVFYLIITFIQFEWSDVFAAAFITSFIVFYYAMVTLPKELKSDLSNWLDGTLIIQPAIYLILKADLFFKSF